MPINRNEGVGFGQTWQNVTGSRVYGTTYYNTTSRPILVCAWGAPGANLTGYGVMTAAVNGVNVFVRNNYHASDTTYDFVSHFMVPPGGSYVISGSGVYAGLSAWLELR